MAVLDARPLPGAERDWAARPGLGLAPPTGNGREAAEEAREAARRAFGSGEAAEGLPEVSVSAVEVGTLSLAALLERAGLAGTRSQARRLIEQGGVRLNGEKVAVATRGVGVADFEGGVARLAVGKRRVALARLVG